MNYYLNVSLIGSSTKNDRCQDVTARRVKKTAFHAFIVQSFASYYDQRPDQKPLEFLRCSVDLRNTIQYTLGLQRQFYRARHFLPTMLGNLSRFRFEGRKFGQYAGCEVAYTTRTTKVSACRFINVYGNNSFVIMILSHCLWNVTTVAVVKRVKDENVMLPPFAWIIKKYLSKSLNYCVNTQRKL